MITKFDGLIGKSGEVGLIVGLTLRAGQLFFARVASFVQRFLVRPKTIRQSASKHVMLQF